MTGLDQAIRARLDEFCESDMCAEVGKAALLAVLDLHHTARTEGDPAPHCLECSLILGAQRWAPCPTLRVIAEKLGVETTDASA